jgi:hypothetical protein
MLQQLTVCVCSCLLVVSCVSDDNGDGCVTFDEVCTLYDRVRADRVGVEPYRILDFVDYASMDYTLSGGVTASQASNLMTLRSGAKEKKVAGSEWNFPSKVTFTEFVKQMKANASFKRKV